MADFNVSTVYVAGDTADFPLSEGTVTLEFDGKGWLSLGSSSTSTSTVTSTGTGTGGVEVVPAYAEADYDAGQSHLEIALEETEDLSLKAVGGFTGLAPGHPFWIDPTTGYPALANRSGTGYISVSEWPDPTAEKGDGEYIYDVIKDDSPYYGQQWFSYLLNTVPSNEGLETANNWWFANYKSDGTFSPLLFGNLSYLENPGKEWTEEELLKWRASVSLTKYGDGPLGTGATLTWALAPGEVSINALRPEHIKTPAFNALPLTSTPNTLTFEDDNGDEEWVKESIRVAFQRWGDVSGLNFLEVPYVEQTEGVTYGCRYPGGTEGGLVWDDTLTTKEACELYTYSDSNSIPCQGEWTVNKIGEGKHGNADIVIAAVDPKYTTSFGQARFPSVSPSDDSIFVVGDTPTYDISNSLPGYSPDRYYGSGTIFLSGFYHWRDLAGTEVHTLSPNATPNITGDDRKNVTNVSGVVAHELGHVFGLGHTADLGTVMAAGPLAMEPEYLDADGLSAIQRTPDKWALSQGDIAGIQALYGLPQEGIAGFTIKGDLNGESKYPLHVARDYISLGDNKDPIVTAAHGLVGINVTQPKAQLHVRGATYLEGNLFSDSSITVEEDLKCEGNIIGHINWDTLNGGFNHSHDGPEITEGDLKGTSLDTIKFILSLIASYEHINAGTEWTFAQHGTNYFINYPLFEWLNEIVTHSYYEDTTGASYQAALNDGTLVVGYWPGSPRWRTIANTVVSVFPDQIEGRAKEELVWLETLRKGGSNYPGQPFIEMFNEARAAAAAGRRDSLFDSLFFNNFFPLDDSKKYINTEEIHPKNLEDRALIYELANAANDAINNGLSYLETTFPHAYGVLFGTTLSTLLMPGQWNINQYNGDLDDWTAEAEAAGVDQQTYLEAQVSTITSVHVQQMYDYFNLNVQLSAYVLERIAELLALLRIEKNKTGSEVFVLNPQGGAELADVSFQVIGDVLHITSELH